MKKLILVFISVVCTANAMQNDHTPLLKFALMRFVETSDLQGFMHFKKNGVTHLIDEEIRNKAKEQYDIGAKKNPKDVFALPSSQIYYRIQELPGPVANTAQK